MTHQPSSIMAYPAPPRCRSHAGRPTALRYCDPIADECNIGHYDTVGEPACVNSTIWMNLRAAQAT
jgi:hypothetical protein